LILQDDEGNGVPLLLNNMREGHLLPFPIVNIPIVGRVPDRLMSTLALKKHNWSGGAVIHRWLETG
jgi:hypothetical protein